MRSMHKFALGISIFIAVSSGCSASALFTFENIPAGTPVPFADSVNGLTASFSGAGAVCDVSFLNLTLQSGNALITDFCVTGANSPIDAAFGAPLSDVSMDFATSGAGPLTLTVFLGATQVGSTTATGTVLSSYPEGTIGFSGTPFDNFTLASSFSISIDNLNAATIVPEPGTMALVAGAVAGLIARGRRRR